MWCVSNLGHAAGLLAPLAALLRLGVSTDMPAAERLASNAIRCPHNALSVLRTTLSALNWLAHLRLAPDRPLLRIGNLAGDFVRGIDLASLHPEIVRGVLQHRAVDAFVDAHPAVRAARREVPAPWSRFAGVLVDVYFDHFLAASWDRHGDGRSLPEFAALRYDELEAHADRLPPRLVRVLPHLRAEDWLGSYARVDGIAEILARMARRSPKLFALAEGWRPFVERYDRHGEAFAALWPELSAFAATTFADD